jgi:hypothetical protein
MPACGNPGSPVKEGDPVPEGKNMSEKRGYPYSLLAIHN